MINELEELLVSLEALTKPTDGASIV